MFISFEVPTECGESESKELWHYKMVSRKKKKKSINFYNVLLFGFDGFNLKGNLFLRDVCC